MKAGESKSLINTNEILNIMYFQFKSISDINLALFLTRELKGLYYEHSCFQGNSTVV